MKMSFDLNNNYNLNLIIFLVLLTSLPIINSQTYYIKNTYHGEISNGTFDFPYKDIQSAFNNSQNSSSLYLIVMPTDVIYNISDSEYSIVNNLTLSGYLPDLEMTEEDQIIICNDYPMLQANQAKLTSSQITIMNMNIILNESNVDVSMGYNQFNLVSNNVSLQNLCLNSNTSGLQIYYNALLDDTIHITIDNIYLYEYTDMESLVYIYPVDANTWIQDMELYYNIYIENITIDYSNNTNYILNHIFLMNVASDIVHINFSLEQCTFDKIYDFMFLSGHNLLNDTWDINIGNLIINDNEMEDESLVYSLLIKNYTSDIATNINNLTLLNSSILNSIFPINGDTYITYIGVNNSYSNQVNTILSLFTPQNISIQVIYINNSHITLYTCCNFAQVTNNFALSINNLTLMNLIASSYQVFVINSSASNTLNMTIEYLYDYNNTISTPIILLTSSVPSYLSILSYESYNLISYNYILLGQNIYTIYLNNITFQNATIYNFLYQFHSQSNIFVNNMTVNSSFIISNNQNGFLFKINGGGLTTFVLANSLIINSIFQTAYIVESAGTNIFLLNSTVANNIFNGLELFNIGSDYIPYVDQDLEEMLVDPFAGLPSAYNNLVNFIVDFGWIGSMEFGLHLIANNYFTNNTYNQTVIHKDIYGNIQLYIYNNIISNSISYGCAPLFYIDYDSSVFMLQNTFENMTGNISIMSVWIALKINVLFNSFNNLTSMGIIQDYGAEGIDTSSWTISFNSMTNFNNISQSMITINDCIPEEMIFSHNIIENITIQSQESGAFSLIDLQLTSSYGDAFLIVDNNSFYNITINSFSPYISFSSMGIIGEFILNEIQIYISNSNFSNPQGSFQNQSNTYDFVVWSSNVIILNSSFVYLGNLNIGTGTLTVYSSNFTGFYPAITLTSQTGSDNVGINPVNLYINITNCSLNQLNFLYMQNKSMLVDFFMDNTIITELAANPGPVLHFPAVRFTRFIMNNITVINTMIATDAQVELMVFNGTIGDQDVISITNINIELNDNNCSNVNCFWNSFPLFVLGLSLNSTITLTISDINLISNATTYLESIVIFDISNAYSLQISNVQVINANNVAFLILTPNNLYNSMTNITNITMMNITLDQAFVTQNIPGILNVVAQNNSDLYMLSNYFGSSNQVLASMILANSTFDSIQFVPLESSNCGSMVDIEYISNFNLSIINTTFNNIQSYKGSALSYDNEGNMLDGLQMIMNILNCTFSNNYAGYKGGALSLFDDLYQLSLSFKNTLFINNSAFNSPSSTIYFNEKYLIIDLLLNNTNDNNTIFVNSSTDSPFDGSPTQILFIYYTNETQMNITNDSMPFQMVSSYFFYNSSFNFSLLDSLNNIYVYDDPIAQISIMQQTAAPNIYECSNGSCTISGNDIVLFGYAYQVTNITITYCSNIVNIPPFTFYILLRPCEQGELNFSSSAKTCFPCPLNYYSLNTSDQSCTLCPTNAFCSGGNNISVNPGYWRPNVNTSEIFLCPDMERCIGGEDPENSCEYGYAGILCKGCNYSLGYVKKSDNNCGRCESPIGSMAIYLLLFVFNIIYTIFYTRCQRKVLQQFHIKKKSDEVKIRRLIAQRSYAKLLVTYGQLINIIINLAIQESQKFMSLMTYIMGLSNPANSILFSIECIFELFGLDSSYYFYYTMIYNSIQPVMLFFVIAIIRLIIWKGKLTPKRTGIMWLTVYSVYFIQQTAIIGNLLSYISCEEVNDTNSYVVTHPDIRCDSNPTYDVYLDYLVIPMLAIWMALLPGMFLFTRWYLEKYSGNKLPKQLNLSVKSVSYDYKRQYWYWTIIIVMLKSIILITSYISPSLAATQTQNKIMIMIIFISIYLYFLNRCNPNVLVEFNDTEKNLYLVLILTLCLASLATYNPKGFEFYISCAGIVIINGFIILKIIHNLYTAIPIIKYYRNFVNFVTRCFLNKPIYSESRTQSLLSESAFKVEDECVNSLNLSEIS